MESLGIYGKIIREYTGDGFITLNSGARCCCHIQAVQLSNGKIIAFCDSEEYSISMYECVGKSDVVRMIQGFTQDNEEFTLEGKIFITFFNMSRLVVLANIIISKKNNSESLELIKFGITNFEFFGNKWKEYGDGRRGLDILTINILDSTIE